MPAVRTAELALGRELQRTIAFEGIPDALLNVRYHLVQEMLASDPLSVFEVVPLITLGAYNRFTVRLREDLNVRLATAAHNLELVRHTPTPDNG